MAFSQDQDQVYLQLYQLAKNVTFDSKFVCGLFSLWCFLMTCNLLWIYYSRSPHNVLLIGGSSFYGKFLTSFRGITGTPYLISQAYSKAEGKPIAIPTFANYHVYISRPDHIRDLNNAPGRQLSFNDVLADVVFPKYTMHGYSYDPEDPHNTWSVATLKSGFQSHLPAMRPALQDILTSVIDGEVLRGGNNVNTNEWAMIGASSIASKIASGLNTRVVLGEELSKNPSVAKAASQYARDAVITTEVLQRTPSILHCLVGNLLMNWSGASKRIELYITALVRNRLSQVNSDNVTAIKRKPVDVVQWLIDSPRKSPHSMELGIMQRTLGFILGTAYQMPMFMTFVLYRLAKHTDYVQPLREEIASMASVDNVLSNTKKDTPLLDSFLKETARLHPLTSGSADRKVTTSFTFSDGTYVPEGNYIRIAQQALMRDEKKYSNPTEFDGFRFVLKNHSDNDTANSQSRFCQPSSVFPFWGSTGRACPGRFYVSMLTKMMVIHILTHYDIKLTDEKATPTIIWGTNIVPSPWIKLLIRRRCSTNQETPKSQEHVIIPQQPPVIPHPVPLIGHIFGFLWNKMYYFTQISKRYPLPIYKLVMPGCKIYVVNSPELITSVQKQKTLAFAPLEAKFAKLLFHPSAKGGEIMNANTHADRGERGLYSEGIKSIHAALLPGEGLDEMNRIAIYNIAASCDSLDPRSDGKAAALPIRIMLMQWLRHEITMATTNSVYGPMNPFKDPQVETAFWDFERNIGMLMINILPSLTARKGYLGRATAAKAFQEYFSKDGHKTASALVKNRFQICADYDLPLEDMARFEVGGVIAITVSTIPTAFWMLYYVFSNPETLERLRDEVGPILETSLDSSKGSVLRTLNITELRTACPLLTSTFQETLRHSALGASVRLATEDTIINGQYLIEKDGIVEMPAHVVHFDTSIWGSSVSDFDPSRFVPNAKKKLHSGVQRAFGGGKNLCPGRHFATTEILALVVMMIMRYDLHLTSATGDGNWPMPKSEKNSLAAAVREPDDDLEVEVRLRKGFEEGKWAFRLEDSELVFAIDDIEK